MTDKEPHTPTPPRWADRLLESFCSPHLLEEVQGDLHELYGEWIKDRGLGEPGGCTYFMRSNFSDPIL